MTVTHRLPGEDLAYPMRPATRRAASLLVLAVVLLSTRCPCASAGVPPAEAAALEDFFYATGGATSWTTTRGWSTLLDGGTPSDPCEDPVWFGVTCDDQQQFQHVVGLDMYSDTGGAGNGLQGTLPESVGNLTHLEVGKSRVAHILVSFSCVRRPTKIYV